MWIGFDTFAIDNKRRDIPFFGERIKKKRKKCVCIIRNFAFFFILFVGFEVNTNFGDEKYKYDENLLKNFDTKSVFVCVNLKIFSTKSL